jgi:YVTN family beta-propeller protein
LLATVPVGPGPVGVGIDTVNHTVYVANADGGTLSVVDARRCNARMVSGCSATPALVTIAGVPLGVAVDEATHTVYVGNVFDTVSVIDGRSCNATTSTGCAAAPVTVAAGPGPAFPTLDPRTHTLYVPDNGPEADATGSTVSVIDTRGCSAVITTGCGQTPVTTSTGRGPVSATLDSSSGTLYVANQTDSTVSVIDAAACNAQVTSGCSAPAATAPVGADPNSGMALSPRLGTLFVVNNASDTISAVDLRHCRAHDTSGCTTRSRTLQTGSTPDWIAFDPATDTLYVSQFLDNIVAVFDAGTCNPRQAAGCRVEAPTVDVGGPASNIAVAAGRHTAYVTQQRTSTLAMIDTHTCNADHLRGCQTPVVRVPLGVSPRAATVDVGTDTLYVTDFRAGLLVIDTRVCNATRHDGCAPVATIPVGSSPIALTVNPRTHTVYVADFDDDNIAVIHGTTCNARNQSGCAQPPQLIPAGESPFGVTIDPVTNTIYVADFGHQANSHTVTLIAGAACDAGRPTCTALPETVTVGLAPSPLAVDAGTKTLYVGNRAANEELGTLSLVNAATCNAGITTGCAGTAPRVSTGLSPAALAIEPTTHTVFSANFGDASVSLVPGSTCNSTQSTGCTGTPRRIAIGNLPADAALDLDEHTLYVTNRLDGTVSVIDSQHPCTAPNRCFN